MTKPLKHILCIDDDENVLVIVQMCLESVGGFQVTCLENGINALNKIKAIKPDLILIDMMMPGVDGSSVLKSLKKEHETRNIPVIFMTARVQTEEIEEYYTLGADGVVPKPFDPMTLSEQLNEIWEKYNDGRF